MNVIEIPVSDVDVPFGRKPRGDYSRLVTSIDVIGLLHPITVVPARIIRDSIAGDGYRLVAGLHRLAAHEELGEKTISAEVFEVDDLKVRYRSIGQIDHHTGGHEIVDPEVSRVPIQGLLCP